MMQLRDRASRRSGVAAVWTLVVMTVVAAMGMVATVRFASLRKQVDADRNRVQALWLARSGLELASDRLLANPDGYTGETVSPIPGGEIKIVVRKHPTRADVYQVESEARYRVGLTVLVQSDRRAVKVQKNAAGTRLEVVADTP
jgi:hypothetical protein